MDVFWVIAILTVLINFFPVRNSHQYSLRIIVSLIPLFLYGAFRVDFGLDYIGYEDYFNKVHLYGINPDDRFEIGYFLFNKILPTFRHLLFLQTLLICTSYFFLFKWYIPAKYSWLGFLILILNAPMTIFFMLSGIRNGIAISLLILSSQFIYKRKITPFLILVLIAFLFHNSVIFIAPLAYFIVNDKIITNKSILKWVFIAIGIILLSTSFLINYVEIFINTYFDKYSTYIEIAKEYEKGGGFLALSFSILIGALLLFIMKNKVLGKSENMIIQFTLLFFISFLLGPLNIRISQYFISFLIPCSILVLNFCKSNTLKSIYFIAIFAYMSYSLNIWYNNPYFSYHEYNSIFFQ